MNYRPAEIEPKWQRFWQNAQIFETKESSLKEKYYILDMFPYPSASGLHVGHGVGYTVTDLLARYKRMLGFHVLHPMGWDSFGLPAEQYALRTGTHPAVTTEENIQQFKKQLQSIGYSYDWSRELRTSDPSYYKWTQWIFGLLYEKGLAYQSSQKVNFCPELGTVLSNEEVQEGKSVEGGYRVVQLALKQWMLKITSYADRLLSDLDLLDWPEHLKKQQRHWIGKSEGVLIRFEGEPLSFEVFTTRPETLLGVEFLLMSPDHPFVSTLLLSSSPEEREKLKNYLQKVEKRADLQLLEEPNGEKLGFFTGIYGKHPVTGKEIPLWLADYVLSSYGTGVVMGVPAHDPRDFAFATEYGLPLSLVLIPTEFAQKELDHNLEQELLQKGWFGSGIVVGSDHGDFQLNGLEAQTASQKAVEWLERRGCGKKQVHYKLRDWLFSRQRYWGEPIPMLHFEEGSMRLLSLDELPLTPPLLEDYKPSCEGKSPLSKATAWVEGIDSKTGKRFWRETNTMPQWAGSCWYYLRFIDPKNEQKAWEQEKERYWMPVDTYVGGAEHAVLHLLYARFWHKVLYDCGLVSTLEPFQQLRNQGMVVAKSYRLKSGRYVKPEEVVSRDGSPVHEPTGQIVTEQLEKMSKSKLNGVNPDQVIEEHGADALRLYTLFMGPFDKEKVWDSRAVSGCSRFLKRIYALFFSPKKREEPYDAASILIHPLVDQVKSSIESWQFNVAIAKMMEFLNAFEKLPHYPAGTLNILARLLAPFAPHLAEELWLSLGEGPTLVYADFPQAEAFWLERALRSECTLVIQIDGKVRARFSCPKGVDQEYALEQALTMKSIEPYLEKRGIKNLIFVPDKLLNIVRED